MSSIDFCKRELEIGNIDWINYLRKVCNWRVQENVMVIGGVRMTVEIDEILFTRRKNNAGH